MNPLWQTHLPNLGAHLASDGETATHFGQPEQELSDAAHATVLAPLPRYGVIDCRGEEARSFLHNQLTSDINHLAADGVQHAAWCTAKGRMLASFLIWRTEEGYRLALAAELLEGILKRLKMYVLRAKVTLSDVSDSCLLVGVSGPQAAAALQSVGLPAPATPMTQQGGVLRLDAKRLIAALPSESFATAWASLAQQARPVGEPVWRWLDIEAALPVITAATQEEFVPQMADFEKIGGVSFHKGCYPGQEIVARAQYLGKIKRHLFRVESDTAMQAGEDLYSPSNPDQACGKIVSTALAPHGKFAALAVIQSGHADDVHLVSRDGPTITATAVNPA